MNIASIAVPLTLVALMSTPSFAIQAGDGKDGTQNPFEGLGDKLRAANLTFASDQNPMSDAEAHALAGRISGMSGVRLTFDPVRSDKEDYVFVNGQDSSTIFEVNLRSRALLFNAGMTGLRGESDTPRLPPQNQARQIARDHLERLDLLPTGPELQLEHIGGLDMAIHREDGSTEEFRKLVTVRFGRVRGDTPVLGPGGRIMVSLGADGALRGLIWDWEHFHGRVLGRGEKLTAPEVESLALQTVMFIAPEADEKEFVSVDVVYFDDGFGVMEPAVRVVAELTFVADVAGKPGVTTVIRNPYDFYIPALRVPLAYYPFMKDQGTPAPARD